MSSSVLVNQCLAGPPRTDLCTRCVRCPVANILRALELTETVAYSAGLYSNKRITLHARGITPSLRARELTPHLRVLREYTPHPSAPRQSTPYPRSPFTGALRELTPHPGAESSPLTQARYDSHHSPVRERVHPSPESAARVHPHRHGRAGGGTASHSCLLFSVT